MIGSEGFCLTINKGRSAKKGKVIFFFSRPLYIIGFLSPTEKWKIHFPMSANQLLCPWPKKRHFLCLDKLSFFPSGSFARSLTLLTSKECISRKHNWVLNNQCTIWVTKVYFDHHYLWSEKICMYICTNASCQATKMYFDFWPTNIKILKDNNDCLLDWFWRSYICISS